MKDFRQHLIEQLSTWDKIKKRYRQGSVNSRIAKHYDNTTAVRNKRFVEYQAVKKLKSVDDKTKDYFWKRSRKAGDQSFGAGDMKFASGKTEKIKAMTRYFDTYAAGKLGMKKPLVRKK